MDAETRAFDTGFGSQVGHVLEGGDVFGPAIRVAGVIHSVNPEKNITAIQGFGQRQRERQHDSVACRHIGARNARLTVRFGHLNRKISERRATKLVHVDMHHAMAECAQCFCLTQGRIEFGAMALAVVKSNRVASKTLVAGDSQGCG